MSEGEVEHIFGIATYNRFLLPRMCKLGGRGVVGWLVGWGACKMGGWLVGCVEEGWSGSLHCVYI